MNLYQIADEYKSIFNEVDENGEITETMMMKLNDIGDAMEKKAIAVASFIKNLQAERDAITEAKKQMALRESRLDKKMEWLEQYLRFNMERTGITEISSSPYFAIKLKKCPVSVDVLDESEIPVEFIREKVTTSIDKTKLKEALQCGIAIPGATLKQNMRLEIK